jgi:hypothetical protein
MAGVKVRFQYTVFMSLPGPLAANYSTQHINKTGACLQRAFAACEKLNP